MRHKYWCSFSYLHINTWYMWLICDILGAYQFLAWTWCWWCQQWHHCICHIRYFMTFGISASSSDGISIMHHWYCHWCHLMPMPMALHEQKIMLHLISIVFTKEMQWCHWWHHHHYVMSMPLLISSHDKISHVIPHFNPLDLQIQWCHWWYH